ncbi:hypothetical protein HY212_06995 [Candidatus Pacearchaeota archaeon]|nr:hypothetical protein [Candidatus Pacearchaeota archaeon]
MNLKKKKLLAVRVLGAGKERIVFVKPRLDEIKEAITKQDIKDLHKSGAIIIKNIGGRKKSVKRKRKRSVGKVKKIPDNRKRVYIILTRKLRNYIQEAKKKGELNYEDVKKLRNNIRNRMFRSKAHLKEQIKEMKNEK